MTNSSPTDAYEGVAVVGMAGRFPRARNVEEYWRNLRDGVECTKFFTDDELREAGVSEELINNPNWVKAAFSLEDSDQFDAKFFEYTPREAELLDPQQRIFLEVAWEALEDAGYDPERYQNPIGVFAGMSWSSYVLRLLLNPEVMQSADGYQIMLANDKDFLATRTSYKMNLSGPSMTIQTACSTSLVAANMACQSLLDYQCDLALAGGVSATSHPSYGYLYQDGGILSPDGYCRAFDAKGAGTVIGQGAGVVVLKRLEDAMADGDAIYAVIKGWAINNDGAAKGGYMAPSTRGQAQAIAEAQAMAEFSPDTVGYIETHGTGTNLGDPIEIAALTQVFRASTDKKHFCAIGSVKTNIGHLDAAAGVAGLIKTILTLKHKTIPPSLHFEEPNPKCNFDTSPFFVNTVTRDWEANGTPRRAGVSSFGIGGTNAHMVLEEAPEVPASDQGREGQVLSLSAKTPTALEEATSHLASYLHDHPDINLADAAYTLQTGRREFVHRRAVVCHDVAGAIQALESGDRRHAFTGLQGSFGCKTAFMFTGQGSQHVNMAAELYRTEPVFRQEVDHCAQLLHPYLDLDIRSIWFAKENEEEAAQQLSQTAITQPVLFVLEYALAQLWRSWGVTPEAMIGHSIGEYVAACLAGVFSLKDALTLVAVRGRLMQEMPPGDMLAVPLPEAELLPQLPPGLDLAVVNGPESCVVSGPPDAIAAFQAQLETAGIEGRVLHTSHAFHSRMMDPILSSFRTCVAQVSLRSPTIPFMSNVTGAWITNEQATSPDYWTAHLRHTVRFHDGISLMSEEPSLVLLEIGPGTTLTRLARGSVANGQVVLSSLPDLHQKQSDLDAVLLTLGGLWASGVSVDWPAFHGSSRRRVTLPTYPFEHQSYLPPEPKTDVRGAAVQRGLSNQDGPVLLPSWRGSSAPAPRGQIDGPILVFSARDGVGARLAEHYRAEGRTIITVIPGETFARRASTTYVVSPRRRDDYNILIRTLLQENVIPSQIIHAWSLDEHEGEDTFSAAQKYGFFSLLSLVQTLVDNITAPIDLLVLSHGMQGVGSEPPLHPEQATLLGPCKVVPQEHANISCRSIDVLVPRAGSWQERLLLDQLVQEVAAPPTDHTVALRGQDRFVQIFEPGPPDTTRAPTRLRHGGVYLITGGLGGLGIVFAEYLARTYRAKLALVGRTALPPREKWDRWLATHDVSDLTSVRIHIIRHLESLGAEVLVLSADVADARQMNHVLQAIDKRFGSLHGVIHAAGMVNGPSIQAIGEISQESCALQFGPKGHGLYVLESLLADRELDFCLMMSSLSTVLGGLRFVAYAAANAFMDAFVHMHNQTHSQPWISVDWDAWRAEAMAGTRSSSEVGITPSQGMALFERILRLGPLPRVVVSATDLQARLDQWVNMEQVSTTEDTPAPPPSHARPTLTTAYAPATSEIEKTIARIWSQLLGITPIGIHDDFFELGGDSFLVARMVAAIRQELKVKLPITTLFTSSTIEQLAEFIAGQQATESQTPVEHMLVDVQSGQIRRPFFFLHGDFVGGGLYTRVLADHMPSDQPFLVLHPYGIHGDPIPGTVEEMADKYLDTIRTEQPEGPYFLGGFSMGGEIAYEIARRLKADGQEVALLLIVDSSWEVPAVLRAGSKGIKRAGRLLNYDSDRLYAMFDILQRIRRDVKYVVHFHGAERRRFVLNLMLKIRWILLVLSLAAFRRTTSEVGSAQDLWQTPDGTINRKIFLGHEWARAHFVPRPYDGVVTLLAARDALPDSEHLAKRWSEVANGVELHIVPGNHVTCVTDHVHDLADEIVRNLNRAHVAVENAEGLPDEAYAS